MLSYADVKFGLSLQGLKMFENKALRTTAGQKGDVTGGCNKLRLIMKGFII
jgi:hypothetical protein